MVHNHENIKLSNKETIIKIVQEKTNIPMGEELFKHNLVEYGVSSYNYKLQDVKEFEPIIDTFKKLVNNKYKVKDFWFNKYKKNGYVIPHNHKPVDGSSVDDWVTGVYYLKKKPNSGNLVVNKKTINIKEDDFIVFDALDIHYSLPNKDEDDRIIFSINMKREN